MFMGTKGPGCTCRPISSATIDASTTPSPLTLPPPNSSGTSIENHPSSAALRNQPRSYPIGSSWRSRVRASGFASGMVDDQGATLARLLGATKTTEVVLTAKDGTVLYRGAIDDNKHNVAAVQNRWVATAITEHLGGKAVSTPKTDVYA